VFFQNTPYTEVFQISHTHHFSNHGHRKFSAFQKFPCLLHPDSRNQIFGCFSHQQLPLIIKGYPAHAHPGGNIIYCQILFIHILHNVKLHFIQKSPNPDTLHILPPMLPDRHQSSSLQNIPINVSQDNP